MNFYLRKCSNMVTVRLSDSTFFEFCVVLENGLERIYFIQANYILHVYFILDYDIKIACDLTL